MSYSYFDEIANNTDGSYLGHSLVYGDSSVYFSSYVSGVKKYSHDDLTLEASSETNGDSFVCLDGDYVYTSLAGANSGKVRKYNRSDLATVATSSYGAGTTPYGIWNSGSYVYVITETSDTVTKFLKTDLSKDDDLTITGASGALGGLWGDATYLYAVCGSKLVRIDLAGFTEINSVTLSPAGVGDSIWGDSTYLYIGIRAGSSTGYVSRYLKDLTYVDSTPSFPCVTYNNVQLALAGADYLVAAGSKTLYLYNVSDLSLVGSGTVFHYVDGLSCHNMSTYVCSTWDGGIYRYRAIRSFPADSVARVSSIRRIYQPGLYRMEIGVGELGFDVEVSEAAIKRVPDEVTEPDEKDEALKEQIEKVLVATARHGRDLARAREQTIIQRQADQPSVFPDLPTIPELLKKPTPVNVLAALSPVAFGRTVYEAGKNIVSTLLKGLFG